jgi:hypothetical protein
LVNFSELQIKDDKIDGVDYDNIGEERKAFAPTLPEADYEFELPSNLANLWDKIELKTGPRAGQERVTLRFSAEDPLRVVTSKDASLIGAVWIGSISNVERNRARRGEPERLVSDLGFFVKNALKDTSKIASQKDLMVAVNKHAGKRFVAFNEWSANCDPGRTRYVTTSEGASVEDPEGKTGCGARYYSSNIPRNEGDGSKADRFSCQCGAALMARGNLVRFRPAV